MDEPRRIGVFTVQVRPDRTSVVTDARGVVVAVFSVDPDGEQATAEALDRMERGSPAEVAGPEGVEVIYEAIRALRAEKTPATWTDAERRLFRMLPEARGSRGEA